MSCTHPKNNMPEKPNAVHEGSDTHPITDFEKSISSLNHLYCTRRLRIPLALLATGVLTYSAYVFARFVSTHSSHARKADGDVVPTRLQKRDELGAGQMIGIAAGVCVLLGVVGLGMWMFWSASREVQAVEMRGERGNREARK